MMVSAPLIGAEIAGIAVKVIDGDTVDIQEAFGNISRVRLYGVDAPEKRQAYGIIAELYLAIRIAGKSITVASTSKDRYGRLIGVILLDGSDINIELVRNGLAWHYRAYAPKDTVLSQNEMVARHEKIGLWSMADPIPPWNYRKGQR